MTQEKIDRINELAKKSRVTKLTDEELLEQQKLRNEYRQGFINNLTGQLENITIVDEKGNKTPVRIKK